MNRRAFLSGLIAAPLVVPAHRLMRLRGLVMETVPIISPRYSVSAYYNARFYWTWPDAPQTIHWSAPNDPRFFDVES